MKVLGVAASPRKGANSTILLDKVLEGASSKGAETEKIILAQLDIKPCQGEGRCHKSAKCFIRDDMQKVYRKLKDCDAVVIASPVYFGSVTGSLKVMIDRCQTFWAERLILKNKGKARKRKGIFISVSSFYRKRFFQNSKEIIQILFMVLGVDLFKELYVGGIEQPKEVLKRKSAIDKAYRYGIDLAAKSHQPRQG